MKKAEKLNLNLSELMNSELSQKLDRRELKANNSQMRKKVKLFKKAFY